MTEQYSSNFPPAYDRRKTLLPSFCRALHTSPRDSPPVAPFRPPSPIFSIAAGPRFSDRESARGAIPARSRRATMANFGTVSLAPAENQPRHSRKPAFSIPAARRITSGARCHRGFLRALLSGQIGIFVCSMCAPSSGIDCVNSAPKSRRGGVYPSICRTTEPRRELDSCLQPEVPAEEALPISKAARNDRADDQ